MNYREQISAYQPLDPVEQAVKKAFLYGIDVYGDEILSRNADKIHITSSGLVLNPSLDRVLLVHHNIYQTYCWTGGHADGQPDLLAVAMQEATEETGIDYVFPLCEDILSLDELTVAKHIHKGELVSPHRHLSVAYGLIAPENQEIRSKIDENSQVCWVAIDRLESLCDEPAMVKIYKKIIGKMVNIVKENQVNLQLSHIVPPLLAWYDRHARVLPWRENTQPYPVWVSEIMLQQTRVEAVKPYFDRFMGQLPTLQSLASVGEEQLLKLWEGLGYYNRVRNLQKAAQIIMEQFDGVFPEKHQDILGLPGIGDYTAGAISSISFKKPIPAVDGNVLRVLARVMENPADIGASAIKKHMTAILNAIYPRVRSGDFTQSLMELGAMICTPNGAPKCDLCPLDFYCKAYKSGRQGELPIKSKKLPRRKEQRTVFVLQFKNQIALHKRDGKGLLGGLWEFPNVEQELGQTQAEQQLGAWGIPFASCQKSINKKHIFTHIEWEMTSYLVDCLNTNHDFQWVTPHTLKEELSLPSAFKGFFELI